MQFAKMCHLKLTFLFHNNEVSDCGLFAVSTWDTATDILPDTSVVTATDTRGAIDGITTAGGMAGITIMAGTVPTTTTGTGGTDGAIGHIVTTDGKLFNHPQIQSNHL